MVNASVQPIDVNRLPHHLLERVRVIRNASLGTSGEFVLYWMHHAVRSHENPALDTALCIAALLQLPLLVYQGLGGRHPFNSDRHHTFIMEGARQVQYELQGRGISHAFHLGRRPNKPSPLKSLAQRALWDVAQKSLLIHGELHNNVRMTWGKAFLNWTRQPQDALDLMIDQNHRFALDGNDPNSYGGLLWCLGLFDRPFKPERAVIGTLRPRSTIDHAKRLNMAAYAAKVKGPVFGQPLKIAVIGGGLSGLFAARNNSKPKRPAAECWVFHANAKWSQATYNGKGHEAAARSLLVSFFESIGRTFIEPMHQGTCYWPSAAAVNPLNVGCLWDAELNIGLCGDWCQMSRVEGAALSGMAMAGRILGAAAKILPNAQDSAG